MSASATLTWRPFSRISQHSKTIPQLTERILLTEHNANMEHPGSNIYPMFRANRSHLDTLRFSVGLLIVGHFLYAQCYESQCSVGPGQRVQVANHLSAGGPDLRRFGLGACAHKWIVHFSCGLLHAGHKDLIVRKCLRSERILHGYNYNIIVFSGLHGNFVVL